MKIVHLTIRSLFWCPLNCEIIPVFDHQPKVYTAQHNTTHFYMLYVNYIKTIHLDIEPFETRPNKFPSLHVCQFNISTCAHNFDWRETMNDREGDHMNKRFLGPHWLKIIPFYLSWFDKCAVFVCNLSGGLWPHTSSSSLHLLISQRSNYFKIMHWIGINYYGAIIRMKWLDQLHAIRFYIMISS